MVRRVCVLPLRFVAHQRLTKNARKYFVPTRMSSGCEIRLGTRLKCEMCLTVYLRLHAASCSIQFSVDELYCCTLSIASAKGEQLSKALLLRQNDRLRRAQEEAGTFEQA